MTIRAIRLPEPLDIDGTPATEQTEGWLAFDDDNVYISATVAGTRRRSRAGSQTREPDRPGPA